MEYYAGIDVSLKESSVCVVDGTGKIVREAKTASEPEALCQFMDRFFIDPDWPGSRPSVTMAARGAGGCRL
jgi:predicted NBD/HSP70 family sugar kinase